VQGTGDPNGQGDADGQIKEISPEGEGWVRASDIGKERFHKDLFNYSVISVITEITYINVASCQGLRSKIMRAK
jgi:hypothetical protein